MLSNAPSIPEAFFGVLNARSWDDIKTRFEIVFRVRVRSHAKRLRLRQAKIKTQTMTMTMPKSEITNTKSKTRLIDKGGTYD